MSNFAVATFGNAIDSAYTITGNLYHTSDDSPKELKSLYSHSSESNNSKPTNMTNYAVRSEQVASKYRTYSYPISSEYKLSIFHYLTDNFVFEDNTIESIIKYILKNKIDINTLNEYASTAELYIQVRNKLLHILNIDDSKDRLFISLIPESYDENLSDAFDKYVKEFLFPNREKESGFEIVIR